MASDQYPLTLSGQQFIPDFLDFPERIRGTIRIDIVPIGCHHLLGHCRALEVVAPGGREFLDWGKVGVNGLYETRGRKSLSAINSIPLADLHLKI